jgi:glycosyltransferase involved in cell wall biosynthesis
VRERSLTWQCRCLKAYRSAHHFQHGRYVYAHRASCSALTEAVPPKLYGGTERVVHWLTEELVALGHDVTLFASGDSQTSGKLDAGWPKALRLDGSVRDPNALHMEMLERVRQKCDDDEFDILHFHLDYYPFSLFARQPTPFSPRCTAGLICRSISRLSPPSPRFPCLDFERAAPPGSAGELRATIYHGLPEKLLTPQHQAELPRRARPYRAGKGRRSRHQDRDPRRHPAENRGQDRPRRRGLLRAVVRR